MQPNFLLSAVLTVLFSSSLMRAAPLTRLANKTLRIPATLPKGSFAREELLPRCRFSQPVGIAVPPGENERLFVLEQCGIISVVPDLNDPYKEIFLDLRDVTQFQGESGLLGLAFHPKYRRNG
jgi:hypothetical protein